MNDAAEKVEKAVMKTIQEGKVTKDLGGNLKTDEVTEHVMRNIQ